MTAKAGRYDPPAGVPAYVQKLGAKLMEIEYIGSPFVWLVTGSHRAEADVWGQVISDCYRHIMIWLELRGYDRVPKIVRHGGASGIDTLAHLRAKRFGWTPDRMPADWQHWGRRSGIIRNAAMVDKQPRADLCTAFFAEISRGTANCAGQARAAGIPTVTITVEDLYMPHASTTRID